MEMLFKKNKTKALLINLHGDTNITSSYLHSLIDSNGYPIVTINFRRMILDWKEPSKQELNTLKNLVDRLNPNVILMSVNSMSFWDAITITNLFSDKIIVWGGVQPLIDPESCMKHVNIICRGEGDEALIEFLKKIEKNKPYGNVKNFWIKQKNGKIIRNGFRPLIKDLDKLPFPDFSDKNKFHILGDKVYRKNPLPQFKYTYNISFSRGCPFNCTYCINHFYNKEFKYKYLRKRSIENVINELRLAKRNFPQLKFINFWDDVFIADFNWINEFVKEYKKYINLPFFAYGNANLVTEKNIKLLKSAGLAFFDIGVQSGDAQIRKNIFGRTDTNEKILNASKLMKKLNIPVAYDIIFSEFEDGKSVETSLNFLTKLSKPFRIHLNKLAYYPNFLITERALSERKITKENIASKNSRIRSQIINEEKIENSDLIGYFLLLGNRFIPHTFVLNLFKRRVHKTNPKLLKILANNVFKINELKNIAKGLFLLILEGEFGYLFFKMNTKFLIGNGADLSKNHFIKYAKHVYLEPDNFYSLRDFFEPESLDFIYSNGLINETKFSRILIKEMLIYSRVGGKILIKFRNNKVSNYDKVLSEIKRCILDKAKIIVAKRRRCNLIVLEKINYFLEKEDVIDKWSFGIITNGTKDDWVEKQIKSIKSQKIPNYEIIICGRYFSRKEKNFKYIPFSEKDDLGWITKKKNLICKYAKYENLCIMHDRIILEKDWFKGMKKYGNYFEILSCKIKNEKGERCGDWITCGNYLGKFSRIGRLDYRDNHKFGYIDGAAYILKKEVWKKGKWNENLFWNQGEDIDLSQRWYKKGFVIRFNSFSSCITLSWRHGDFKNYEFNKLKDSKLPLDFNSFNSIIKFYLKKIKLIRRFRLKWK